MMISYFHLLAIGFSRQPVLHDYGSHLLDLIGLGGPSLRLQVQDLVHAALREDVVAAANAFIEAEATKQPPQSIERYARICRTTQNLNQKPVPLGHRGSLADQLRKAERLALQPRASLRASAARAGSACSVVSDAHEIFFRQ